MEQLRALEEFMRIQAGGCGTRGVPAESATARSSSVRPTVHGALMGRLGKNLSVEEARKKVHVKGFRNFLAVDPKDIGLHILQFCAQHYLCRPGENYYLTDVSKGAMKGKQADHQR